MYEVLQQLPWAAFDRLVAEHGTDAEARGFSSRSHLVAMLYAQLSGAHSLRDITTGLHSHAARLYHLGATPAARSTLADANHDRDSALFVALFRQMLSCLTHGARRKLAETTYLIDSTFLALPARHARWAVFSAQSCGAKAHVIYDPDQDQPIYAEVTAANVNDITAAKEMPIEAGATYVFDLGYYDFSWWARLDAEGCRIVTRFKDNTPLTLIAERALPEGSPILSDRVGRLPERLTYKRRNPMAKPVREIRVCNSTGKLLRILTNDLQAPAQQIADLYQRRWAIELFFRWIKQTLRIRHFIGCSENAVRIQIATALIAFLLLRLAQKAQTAVKSPLTFARLIRVNLMHRRRIKDLLTIPPRRTQAEPQRRQPPVQWALI
jgi:hypothetical protein